MPQAIDLEGLPKPVDEAIAETVPNLKPAAEPPRDLPSRPGTAIGTLRRVETYDER